MQKAEEKSLRNGVSGDMECLQVTVDIDMDSWCFGTLGLGLLCQINNPNKNRKTKWVPNPNCLLGGECCATAVLSSQDDFKSTRSRLQEIVEDAGHIIILYPKFHCEFNWIEYYWGRCKYFTRKNCNYSLSGKRLECSTCTWVAACSLYLALGLREVVPQALESVKGSLICKERTQRILKAYREEAVFGDAAYKQQVYRSRRHVHNLG